MKPPVMSNEGSLVVWRLGFFNLKTVVGREKAVQAIDVHRECINCVVTFLVMSQFLHFLGASRACADFRDPTAVFRMMGLFKKHVLTET